jgi:hypothetical protein
VKKKENSRKIHVQISPKKASRFWAFDTAPADGQKKQEHGISPRGYPYSFGVQDFLLSPSPQTATGRGLWMEEAAWRKVRGAVTDALARSGNEREPTIVALQYCTMFLAKCQDTCKKFFFLRMRFALFIFNNFKQQVTCILHKAACFGF